jgi:hypothetical protein
MRCLKTPPSVEALSAGSWRVCGCAVEAFRGRWEDSPAVLRWLPRPAVSSSPAVGRGREPCRFARYSGRLVPAPPRERDEFAETVAQLSSVPVELLRRPADFMSPVRGALCPRVAAWSAPPYAAQPDRSVRRSPRGPSPGSLLVWVFGQSPAEPHPVDMCTFAPFAPLFYRRE